VSTLAPAAAPDARAVGQPTTDRPPPLPDPSTAAQPRPLGRWLALAVGLTGLTAAALVWWIGPGELAAALAGMSPTWLAVAVGIEALAVTCLSRSYRAVVSGLAGEVSRAEAARIALGSFSLSQLLPAGGAVGGVYAARRLGRVLGPVGAATAVAAFGVISLGTLGLLVSAGTAAAAIATGVGTGIAVATTAGTMGLVVVGILLARAVRDPARRALLVTRAARLARRDPATTAAWIAAAERQGDVLAEPARLLPAVGWSALNWTCDIAVLWAVTVAVGLDLSPMAVMATYGVANLANTIPITPGGIGLVEAGITGTLVTLGVDAGSAALVALGFRIIGDLLPVAIAVPVVASGWRREAAGVGGPTHPAARVVAAG
jgi:uncharacterized membrane protein YbhN (UPF0104 family)